VVAFRPIEHVGVAQEWNISGAQAGQFGLALVTFLYVDILDCVSSDTRF